jgi:hypothetical protein
MAGNPGTTLSIVGLQERKAAMPEERVVLLEKWEPSYERRELSLVNPAKLRETIRTMGDQESAALWIYIGGDPEEVGYPVTPWLAVSTNRGMI